MSEVTLRIIGRDPVVARDGRPFGAGQGNRMRGLGWPLPSVVAGSLRTALVKASPDLDFTDGRPQRLLAVEVAGVFPVADNELYLPAPGDCLWDEKGGKVHRVRPVPLDVDAGEGADFPADGLRPVRLTAEQAADEFKGKAVPAWWPRSKYADWLTDPQTAAYPPDWFTGDNDFLAAARTETRDHVRLCPNTGAAAEGELFTTAGLNLTHLPRYGVAESEPFRKRFADITLSARVRTDDAEFRDVKELNVWHPLGGERRLVHWQAADAGGLWECPQRVKAGLDSATHVRMVLATPAIFKHGWKPDWLKDGLEGAPPGAGVKLKLVGVSNARWKAVSGWSLAAATRGPKATRRMVPAGAVYFFEKVGGDGRTLADGWLRPVSDDPQDRNDGFGLALWGVW